MNQIKLNNDNIIYTSEITQKQFDCFNDNITDWISVYPEGNLNFLCKWVKHFRIQLIRDMISMIIDNKTALYLIHIDTNKMVELANILYPNTQIAPVYATPVYATPDYKMPLRETNTNIQTTISVNDLEKNISMNIENNKKFKTYIPPHKRNIIVKDL